MKLEQLLQLIKDYNNTFYFRKLIKGEHDRAKKLKEFVDELGQAGEYTLLPKEEYQLALLLISFQDDITLITQCKQLFHHSALFFKTFAQLESAHLIDESNFSKIHTNDCNKSTLLNELCTKLKGKLNKRLLAIVLVVVDTSHSKNNFLACIKLLGAQLLLQDEVLQLFEKHSQHFFLLLDIFKALATSNQLNSTNLKLIAPHDNLLFISELLPQLNLAKVEPNSPLLKSICENQEIYNVSKACEILIAWDASALNIACVESLLQHKSLWTLCNILKLLRKNNLLTPLSLNAVLLIEESNFSFSQSLALLAKRNLLNSINLYRLIDSMSNAHAVYEAITCLDTINLLTEDTLTLCISNLIPSYLESLLLHFPKHIVLNVQLLKQLAVLGLKPLSNLIPIINTLDKKQLLQESNFVTLLKLPTIYLPKILELINSLDSHNLLNNEHLDILFMVFATKLPRPQQQQFAIKTQGNITRFEFIDAHLKLYVTQEKEQDEAEINTLRGGQAQIFQACESLENGETHYLVKSFKTDEHVDKTALRETKYAHFLGRESYFFQKNKQWYVISQWQKGQALYDMKPDELIALPLKMRIKSLCYLFHELSQLHKHFRIHGDIKPQNCVLDIEASKLKLIDFGSTRKVKPKNYPLAWSPGYLDKNVHYGDPTNRLSFCDDMYSAGFIAAALFPELYQIELAQIRFKQPNTTFSIQDKAIVYLVQSLQSKEKNTRCTSQIATEYCQHLFTHFETLDAERLDSILEQTLSKKACSFEDVLLDKQEVLSFSPL